MVCPRHHRLKTFVRTSVIAQDNIQSVLTICKLIDKRSRNTNSNTALLLTQFSSLQFVQLTQLPQNSLAATRSIPITSSSLGLYPNNDMSQAETEHMDVNYTDLGNIMDNALNNA